jgi:SAM-dependent methyltransferase
MPEARYDGFAAWYDELAGGYAETFAGLLAARAAGFAEPRDVVVDVGCGTGLHINALRARGLRPIGVDLSADQLRIAHERTDGVIQADAAGLPLRAEAIPVAVAAFIDRDVDDFASAAAEIARVLQPGGRFVYVGTHPCFVGAFIKRATERDAGELAIRSGYGDTRLVFEGSGTAGLSARVGSRNRSLTAFLGALLHAGLRIESFEELDTRARPWAVEPDDQTIVPWNILLVATKS